VQIVVADDVVHTHQDAQPEAQAACRMTDGVSIGAAIATPTYVGLAPGAVGVLPGEFPASRVPVAR